MLATPGSVFAPSWMFLYQVATQVFKAVFPPSAWGRGAKSNTKESNKIPPSILLIKYYLVREKWEEEEQERKGRERKRRERVR